MIMADCLFAISLTYLLLILFAECRILWKFSLILQFVVGWLILELAWVHGAVAVITLIMALGDINDWSFKTVIGIGLTIYNMILLWQIHQQGENSKSEFDKTLPIGLGEDYAEHILPERKALIPVETRYPKWLKPFSFKSDKIETIKNITYGSFERNTLDLYKPNTPPAKPMPVMLQVHGGGWTLGYSDRQGLPLRNKLVEAGWIYVAINYRLSPTHKFPIHLVDCKKALHWIKENIAQYGGDPDFIMVTGGSAGGHLCSLLALTANQHQELFQPEFENADTSVQGCIPMYGVYDFADRNGHRSELPMIDFLEKNVMPEMLSANPAFWDLASPIAQAHADRPPFMVVHGELDTLSFVEDAKYFVKALRETSDVPCVYTELPTTQHAFDIFYSPRCIHTINAMHTFAEYVYSEYLTDEENTIEINKLDNDGIINDGEI
jgi:acetyl esterase/lipase